MSKGLEEYRKKVDSIIDRIYNEQIENIDKVADLMVDTIANGSNIFVFGPSHAGMFTEEMVYRAGSICVVNPIHAAALLPNARPMIMTSAMERLQGYAEILLDSSPLKEGDLLIIHSVSARLPIVIEFAIKARAKGIKVASVVSMDYANNVTSLDESGKMLNEVSDIVIDNCGEYGDACIKLDGMVNPVAPTSTVSGSFIANSIYIRTCEKLLERGIDPPVYRSGNIDGASDYNNDLVEKHKDHIYYML